MRHRLLLLVSAVAALSSAVPSAHAQTKDKLIIDSVRVGFPAVGEPDEQVDERNRLSYFKAGFWTPIYLDFTAGPDGVKAGTLQVETTDAEDVQNVYTVELPRNVPPNEPAQVMTYARPGSITTDFVFRIALDGRLYKEQKKAFDSLTGGDVLYLTLGSRVPGLRQSLFRLNNQAAQAAGQQNALSERSRSAYVDYVPMLPTKWFGYSGADMVFVLTGNRDFTSGLLNEREGRKEALAEWVRRGGKLVISCGRNQDMAAALVERMNLDLPVAIKEQLHLTRLDAVETWLALGNQPLTVQARSPKPGAPAPTIDVAKLEAKPGRSMETIIPSRSGENSPLLMVRAPVGLGQVILVGFDLEQPPFAGWGAQEEFWKKFQQKTNTRPPAPSPNNPYAFRGEDSNDLASGLQRTLENFEDVPVISFGWVALFILIYIIIVGPVDYFFLKKVVKRLELTWVTFPTVVLLVSGVAYFAAYSLKGKDLKINKIDLVDVDLRSGQNYGQTWFTLFSPRIQLYTVGVEPAAPTWAVEPAAGTKPEPSMVTWLGRPESGFGGFNRPHSQSLFRRTYEYADDAAGLRGVPIQVWSVKSFAGAWSRAYDPASPPFEVRLRRNAEDQGITGTVTSKLPLALENAVLIYSDGRIDPKFHVLSLGLLEPGQTRKIDIKAGTQDDDVITGWLNKGFVSTPTNNMPVYGQQNRSLPQWQVYPLVKSILFFDASQQKATERNTVFRPLEEGWRVSCKNDAMIFGQLAHTGETVAEAVAQSPLSPTRLWLGSLPGTGEKRSPLDGTMTQDTFVRVLAPVEAAPEKP